MTQHNKSGADFENCLQPTKDKYADLRFDTPVADAGVKRPAQNWSPKSPREYFDASPANAYMDSLELQLTQSQGKNVELAERVKELERMTATYARLRNGKYLSWQSAGGPNECLHGVAAGISCRSCDEGTISRFEYEQSLSSAASGKDGE